MVQGQDIDGDPDCDIGIPFPVLAPSFDWSPGRTCYGEDNYAKGEIDLSPFVSGLTRRISFTIHSLPSAAPGSTLAFKVSGYVEVFPR